MNPAEQYREAAFTQVVKIGKALGNVSRLKILDNLVQGKKSVEALAQAVGLTVKTTSKNLQLLKKVGLVQEERHQNFIVYDLASSQVAAVISLLIDLSEQQLPGLQELEENLKQANSSLTSLSIPSLRQMMVKQDPYLLDLRPKAEFEQAHLPGAHNLPYDQIGQHLNDLPKDRQIVVYCRGRLCGYSNWIGSKLQQAGYKVATFNQTVWEWKQAVQESEQ